MGSCCTRTLPSRAALLLVLCLSTVSLARADVVPWMTGDFYSGNGFSIGSTSPDGQWAFDLYFYPVLGTINWDWNCWNGDCYGSGMGPIIGGGVYGDIYSLSGGSPVMVAGFPGSITGGSIALQQWTVSGQAGWRSVYDFWFAGIWTNNCNTSGFADVQLASDLPPDGYYELHTYTPEPATIALSGIGCAALYARLRRRA